MKLIWANLSIIQTLDFDDWALMDDRSICGWVRIVEVANSELFMDVEAVVGVEMEYTQYDVYHKLLFII